MSWKNVPNGEDKIISISKYFGDDKTQNNDEESYIYTIIEAVIDHAIFEIKVGLGLLDLPKGINIDQLNIFNKIAELYEEAAGNCYFCSNRVDPNGDEFGPDTKLCLICKKKLANFTQALDINPSTVFNSLNAPCQKSKIKFKTD